jgi:hypothetical protein
MGIGQAAARDAFPERGGERRSPLRIDAFTRLVQKSFPRGGHGSRIKKKMREERTRMPKAFQKIANI